MPPSPTAPPADTVNRVIADNWRAMRTRLDQACASAGRDPRAVDLLPVTKSVGTEEAAALHAAGARAFGENRVDEVERKAADFAARGLDARWHFIGNLQRNKARRVARVCDVVHSVSSPRLLEALARVAAEESRVLDVYLEVHLSGEDEKHGFAPEELDDAVRAAADAPALRLVGLMTMAPRPGPDDTDGDAAAACFARCADLARALAERHPGAFPDDAPRLSMGMSGDWRRAVAAGSTCVRIGRALFAGAEEGA